MKKKQITTLLLTGIMILTAAGCGSQTTETTAASESKAEAETAAASEEETENADDFVERNIDVCLNSYDEKGGMFSITEDDGNGGTNVYDFGLVGLLAAEGETIESAMNACGYSAIEPASDDFTFEGWFEYVETTTIDEDGFESSNSELVTDVMYTTEELLALTVPDHPVYYIAKWAEIPAEEYFHSEVWENTESSGAFAFSSNGGEMTFFAYDEEFTSNTYTYWMDGGQALNDIMGTEYGAALIDIKMDGAEFTGWTLYEGDSAFWNDEPTEEDGITSFLFDPEDEDVQYLLLRNAEVIRELSSTEELCGISIEDGKCYFAEANWE